MTTAALEVFASGHGEVENVGGVQGEVVQRNSTARNQQRGGKLARMRKLVYVWM